MNPAQALLIATVDNAPDDLRDQTPFTVRLMRELPGDDRPDYWLASVDRGITWRSENGERAITHVVIAARWVGTAIERGVRDLPVGIAYVTDSSLLDDERLDVAKIAYVAIGTADAIPLPKPRTWSQRILGIVGIYIVVAILSIPILIPLFARSRVGAVLFLIVAPVLYLAADFAAGKLSGSWGESTPLLKVAKFSLFILAGLVWIIVSVFISALFK